MRIVDRFDAFLADIDGTVASGDKPVARAVAALRKLRKTGKPLLFVTNNARRSPREWAKRLEKMGIAARPGEVVTSAVSTAFYIRRKFKPETNPGKTTVFVSGSAALRSEIRKTGVKTVSREEATEGCDAVVIGAHPGFGYADIAVAGRAVRNGAVFIATNSNFVYPSGGGEYMPATGALAAAVEKVSGKKPLVTGKPHPAIFEICLKTLGVSPERVAVIGDSLKTDIKGGNRAGAGTVLVLTGITVRGDVKKSGYKPDYVIEDLSGLFLSDMR